MDSLLQWLAPLFAAAFSLWGSPATWTEIAALVLSLAMVFFNIRVNPWGWPLAILASLLYFAHFWSSKLYGEVGLQIFFVVVAFWGWWQWLRGQEPGGAVLHVRELSARGRWISLAAFAMAWPLTGLFCMRPPTATFPGGMRSPPRRASSDNGCWLENTSRTGPPGWWSMW
jgi:nicotinamide mononucleotide transporter